MRPAVTSQATPLWHHQHGIARWTILAPRCCWPNSLTSIDDLPNLVHLLKSAEADWQAELLNFAPRRIREDAGYAARVIGVPFDFGDVGIQAQLIPATNMSRRSAFA